MTLFIGNLKVARIITLSSVSLHAFPYIVQKNLVQFSSVSRSVVSDSLWPPWTAAHQASLSTTNSESLLKLMSIESVMPSNHLVLCRPVLLKNLCQHQVFSSESVLRIRWPKYWSFSFSTSPSNEHPGLISFRMDCLESPCCPRDSQESSLTPQFKKHQFFGAQLCLWSNS